MIRLEDNHKCVEFNFWIFVFAFCCEQVFSRVPMVTFWIFAGFFKERILFLTVSQSPNVERLRTRIWGFIMGNQCLNANYVAPQWLPQFECKSESRNLVVLDDVWSLSVLEQLVCRIPGCKFLVVSREKFAICNATYEVELLSEEDALSLFCHHAFGQKSIPLAANENLVKQVMV